MLFVKEKKVSFTLKELCTTRVDDQGFVILIFDVSFVYRDFLKARKKYRKRKGALLSHVMTDMKCHSKHNVNEA